MTKEALHNLLTNPVFVKGLIQDLLGTFKHDVVKKPRLYFTDSPRGKRYLPPKGSQKKDYISLEPEYDEDHYDDNKKFYRRDSFLTGGAVCAKILEKLYNVPPVINDVDIFYYQYKSTEYEGAASERYNNLTGEEQCYYIHKVKEVGKLNLIRIQLEDEFSWKRLLESFDLNYSQIGINLHTKEIIFTEHFLEFLQKRIIEIVPSFDNDNPLTTYLRAVHKAGDLQAKFFDKEILKNFLTEYVYDTAFSEEPQLEVVFESNEADNTSAVFVTEKRFKYWLENPTVLPYLRPVQQQDKAVMKIEIPEEPWVENAKYFFSGEDTKEDLFRTVKSAIPNILDMRKTEFRRLKALFSSNLLPMKSYSSGKQWMDIIKVQPRILKEDLPVKKLMQVEDFIKSHDRFIHKLSYMQLMKGTKVTEFLDLLIGLKGLDLSLLGILETTPFEGNDIDNFTPTKAFQEHYSYIKKSLDDLNFHVLREALEELYRRQLEKKILVFPKDQLPLNLFKKYAKEVVQIDELQIEGRNMNHCVGGYGQKVKEGRSRIVHIQVGEHHSTLEIGITMDKMVYGKKIVIDSLSAPVAPKQQKSKRINYNNIQKYSDVQHRGKYNSTPNKANLYIAKLIIKYLNNYR